MWQYLYIYIPLKGYQKQGQTEKKAIKQHDDALLNYVNLVLCNGVTEQIISGLRKISDCNHLFILMFVIKPSFCYLWPLYDERSIQRR